MKNLFFALLFLPFFSNAQDCKLRASAGGHEGMSDITKKELSTLTKLDVKTDCPGTAESAVASFEFTTKVKGNVVSYKGIGPQITTEMKAAIDAAQKDSRIFFDNVKVKEDGGKVKTVPGLTLIIKQ